MNFLVGDAESVLVAGPVLSGRRRVVHRTLCERSERSERSERPILISTRQPAAGARSEHRRLAVPAAATDVDADVSGTECGDGGAVEPVVVDCVTSALGRSPTDDAETRYAQHPSNLTSIGTKFTECLEAHGDGSVAVGVDTISPLLAYADAASVFRFVHILVQKATAADHPVVVGIDTGAHDDQTVEQFVPIFEQVVETRHTDEQREGRVRYPSPSEWRPL
ncbi:DUF7504 family protein [Halorubrum laminariae]|uniref:Uncharacterized protein n=1 Tax=Halorubrum laminariae TaxID=1433523 RepID=A0ABD6C104_9EURY|nr:hypothetical protein [Halorubrum laminariae]